MQLYCSKTIINNNVLITFNNNISCLKKTFHGSHHHHRPSFGMCYQTTNRRSGNYGHPTWDYTYIESLNTNHIGESFAARRDELKKRVENILKDKKMKEFEKVELIGDLQRLGCSYHFEDEIKEILMDIYMKKKKRINDYESREKDLHSTALEFRVFRQNGFSISQDVFDSFMDKERSSFNASLCKGGIEGLLSLYEASFMSIEGEDTLESAKDFSIKHLKNRITYDKNKLDPNILALVQHALELPLHWRMPRLEARFYIDSYQRKTTSNPHILELAKLDFNIVQGVHVEDLKLMSRWWKNSNIGEKMKFVRDRVVENFFWTIGLNFNPKYANCRRMETKLNCLICTVDDIYDVYGTLHELQQFTNTIERWDNITKIEHLPEYMKFCYVALHNFINEVALDIHKEHGIDMKSYLRKAWVDICKAYLQEAKWHQNGYTPTFEEYIENSWISISCPLILVHAFSYVNNQVDEKTVMNCLSQYHEIVRLSSLILRLANDKGTSYYEMGRGDVPKAIECYMSEAMVSVDEARDYIDCQMNEIWKKMNKIRLENKDNSLFSDTFIEVAMNIARMAQCMYEYGDGHGIKNFETQTRIHTTLFEPIPLIYP